MVVTYYIKLFWTWVDRHNSISMSLLLLVAETTRVETTDKKERIWCKDLEQDWNELYEKFQNINTEPIESNLLVLIWEWFLRHRSCISQQLKAFSKPAMKTLYWCTECVQVTDMKTIFDTLCHLEPFVRFKKREKYPWKSVTFTLQIVQMVPNLINCLISFWCLYEWLKTSLQFPQRQKKFCSSPHAIIKHLNPTPQYQEYHCFQKLCSAAEDLHCGPTTLY